MKFEKDNLIELIKMLKKRGEMFIQPFNYPTLVAFITGYDFAINELNINRTLDGFEEWLHIKLKRQCNLGWDGIILRLFAKNNEEKAVELFFELFEDFYQVKLDKGIDYIFKHERKVTGNN